MGINSSKLSNKVESEQILFDLELSKKLKINYLDIGIMKFILDRMLNEFISSNKSQSDKIFEHCYKILKSFFNYMGKVTLESHKISSLEWGEEKNSIDIDGLNNKLLEDRQGILTVYQNSEINSMPTCKFKEWYNLTELQDGLEYEGLLIEFRRLYKESNRIQEKEKAEKLVEILSEYFFNLPFTFIGGYAYIAFTKEIFAQIKKEVEYKDENMFDLQILNERERSEKVEKEISITWYQLERYKENIRNNEKEYTRLVKKRAKESLSLFNLEGNLSEDKEMGIETYKGLSDSEKLKVFLTEYAKAEMGANKIVLHYLEFLRKPSKEIEGIKELLDQTSKIENFDGVEILDEISKYSKSLKIVFEVISKEAEKIKLSSLSVVSKKFLDEYRKIPKYELEILYFCIEKLRYKKLGEEYDKKEIKRLHRTFIKGKEPTKWTPYFSYKNKYFSTFEHLYYTSTYEKSRIEERSNNILENKDRMFKSMIIGYYFLKTAFIDCTEVRVNSDMIFYELLYYGVVYKSETDYNNIINLFKFGEEIDLWLRNFLYEKYDWEVSSDIVEFIDAIKKNIKI